MSFRWIGLAAALFSAPLVAAEYDPLSVPPGDELPLIQLTVTDAARQRDLPLKAYLPKSRDARPVVLFSHGLGGSREGSAFLGKHWSARGYVVIFMQHPGSDDSIWKDAPPGRRMAALQQAASPQNFLARVQDVKVLLDQLEKWNADANHQLAARVDLSRTGMSGHSFGALTTQAVAGQSLALGGQRFLDPRIKAAVIMSPGVPKTNSAEQAFGSVKLPWLLMTGTQDGSPIGGQTIESRRDVFPALPPGNKYELVLNKAEHSVFTERALPGDKQQRNPNHHRAILALSTAFWDAYLRNDDAAKTWLAGPGPRSVLEKDDLWQAK